MQLQEARRTSDSDERRALLVALELRSRRPDRVVALTTEALRNTTHRVFFRLARARAHIMSGSLGDARTDLDQVLTDSPENPQAMALVWRVEAMAKAGDKSATSTPGVDKSATSTPLSASAEEEIVDVGEALVHEEGLLEEIGAAPGRAPGGEFVEHVRALALRGDRAQAMQLLSWHLEVIPGDTDARTLRGTILSWEGRYDEAHRELSQVLATNPGHADASRAALRVALWSDHPERAEEIATAALQRDPDSLDLYVFRARARLARGALDPALGDIDYVLSRNPKELEAKQLRDRMVIARRMWSVGSSYAFDTFNDGRTPWHEATLQFGRKTPYGTVILRGYEGWRWNSSGNQFEIEAFPKIREGTYFDVGAAFSPEPAVYPRYRLQIDLYQMLPAGFEVSGGYRHMQFDSGVDMCVLSVGKYLGNWYFVVRSFITPGVAGASVSVHGSVRRYFFDGSTYLGLRFGHGLSKEEVRSVNDIALLSSDGLNAEAATLVWDRLEIGLRGGVSEQSRVNQADLWQYSVSTSVGYRF